MNSTPTPVDPTQPISESSRATTPIAAAGLVSASTLDVKDVEYLWRGYLPLGVLIVLDGEPGKGKSTLTYDLAARLSTGGVMPDGSQGIGAASSILLNAEDDPARVIVPRLMAAGANLDKVMIEADSDRLLVLDPTGIARLEDMMRASGARLVVIDPIVAFLPGSVNTNSDADVRQVLAPLARLAERYRATIILVRHLNKAVGMSAINRGGGSIGFTGAARSTFLFGLIPGDPDPARRALAGVKANLGPMPPTLTLRIVEAGNGTTRLAWGSTINLSADDLVRLESTKGQRELDAGAFLRDLLTEGPMPATVIEQRAVAEGIRIPTLKRAKHALGIVSARSGFGPGSHSNWQLPDSPELIPYDDTPTESSTKDQTPETNGPPADATMGNGKEEASDLIRCEPEATTSPIGDHFRDTAETVSAGHGPPTAADVLRLAADLAYPAIEHGKVRVEAGPSPWRRFASPAIPHAHIQLAHDALTALAQETTR